jgi:hypothetical protein
MKARLTEAAAPGCLGLGWEGQQCGESGRNPNGGLP